MMIDRRDAFEPFNDFLKRPELFVHKFDLSLERALIVELSSALMRSASFLDDRILTPETRGKWVRLSALRRAVGTAASAAPLHFIFHTGHVGSTLLSRMIEGVGTTIALREPVTLRSLADAHDVRELSQALLSPADLDQLAIDQMTLWSRGYEDTSAVIVKATSTAGRLGPWLLRMRPSAKAVYLNLSLEPFLATLLAGANSPTDLRGHGPERVKRLQMLINSPIKPLHALSLGELAALTWATETLTQRKCASGEPDRVMTIDFDHLLEKPGETLGTVFRHFELKVQRDYVENIRQHPVLATYAKDTNAPYTPEYRKLVLEDSRRRNAGEMRNGLRWLEALARNEPAVERLLLA